jgi:hypothetical protein
MENKKEVENKKFIMENKRFKMEDKKKWYSYKNGVNVQHAGNGGEQEIFGYKLDGYVKIDDDSEQAIEIHGYLWHGCNRYNDPKKAMFEW